jgi:hypothetical protein
MQGPDDVDALLRMAIKHRRLIRFVYHNKERIVEPHDYGILNGARKLSAIKLLDPAAAASFQIGDCWTRI